MQQRTSSSSAPPAAPLFVVPSGDASASLEVRRALAAHLDDPLNRYYRYPAARALLRVAGGLPLRPDHITYLHTTMGALGAAVMAFGTSRNAMLV